MATTKPAPAPSTMKAVRIEEYGDAGRLKYEDAPHPVIRDDQILVRIRFAGTNPVDWKIRAGYMKNLRPAKFPLTLGQDFAGEVVERGKAAANFRAGEPVFGFAEGTYAEYAAAQVSLVAAIPKSMNFETAAALPTAGLTALQAIRDIARVKKGMRILIQGAAGAVGSFAVQIANQRGAEVIGTASGEDVAYLRSLKPAQVIDYKKERFENKLRELDAVVDLVGGETLERSYALVKRGGTLVTTAGSIDVSLVSRNGIHGIRMVMERNADDLVELAEMVERGAVKPRIGQVFALKQANEAQELSEKGGTRGKVLLKVE